MLPKWHILIGFVVSYILVYFFDFSIIAGLIIFLTSFLIDVDHYFLFIIKKKNLSLGEAYNWCVVQSRKWRPLSKIQKRKFKLSFLMFHGVEFLILLAVLSYFHIFFLWVLIGVLVHLAADIPDLVYKRYPLYFKLSQIYTWQTNKTKQELK